jgi:hypothetical protein
MVVPGRLRAALCALMILWAWSSGALASGPGAIAPWYLDEFGGEAGDLKAFYAGRVGIVMPTAPRPMLFINWRLLHGQRVGPVAGERLSTPCCGSPWSYDDASGWRGWSKARAIVPGAPTLGIMAVGHRSGDFVENLNCFGEAFDVASATLKDRAARYGAASPGVRAWLAAQDAVFATCSNPGSQFPALSSGAPAWLVADHAYQAGALALYAGRYPEAAERFGAIGRDATSPWRGSGPYLVARAWVRAALAEKTPTAYARANAAVTALAAAPTGALGRGEASNIEALLAYNENPEAYLAQLDRDFARPSVGPDVAVRFRDYSDLGDKAKVPPEALDWIATMKARGAGVRLYDSDEPATRARREATRQAALGHALDRWRAGRDVAWLVAALSLTSPQEAQAAQLVRDADAVPAASPGWLSVQYHRVRLTLQRAPAAESRRRLDGLLARKDLSASDRGVFTALRAQVASGPGDFVRYALRRRLCAQLSQTDDIPREPPPSGCVREVWDSGDDVQPSGIYDGVGVKGVTGLGQDALAAIDRAPLATRIALSRDKRLPRLLRLDLALTSYGRAVQLQDDAAIDGLARDLSGLLPLMAQDFQGVAAARAGPDKRFAEFLVLAKIPGVRPDLVNYTRPEGRRVADFQSHWADWLIMVRPALGQQPPPLAEYQAQGGGAGVSGGWPDQPVTPDALSDLTCLGECGTGSAPLRLPDFLAAGQARAMRERARFVTIEGRYDGKAPAYPAGGVSAWDEMLAYAAAHPHDPRVPEALHWLVHVGHFGGSHNHSGRRAFKLLHARYPENPWTRKTPYYND